MITYQYWKRGMMAMNVQTVIENLQKRKIHARYFETAEQAKQAICQEVTGKRVGFGGSMTLQSIGLYEALQEKNEMFWHSRYPAGTLSKEEQRRAEAARA